ncbi:MAG TPA: S41 family peptidase, partial [Bacteroidia bacterium]|nr:S41 family peptidase [Bacteroidia bacterium]
VMAVVPGGPSEHSGLLPGDRIFKANDTVIAGKNISDKKIRTMLRGPEGTKVRISVRRPFPAKDFVVEITRGSVPIYSVEAKYMLDSETGYIRLSRFAETSYREFTEAADSLLAKGMKKMVLDLRGNGGGYMDAATDIADEFLPEGKLIVYTKGRTDGEHRVVATRKGKLEKMPLAILVDENSASASEILAGAIQDNDRGVIIGRRTFGKGLVQEEKHLTDGSGFRLTIARYYTPTGRCIQKPYDKGLENYESDEEHRYKHGELLNKDSIKFPDSLKYKTPGGKTVYGGGGIMPDIFIPLDTAGGSDYLSALFGHDIFSLWAMNFASHNRDALVKNGREDFRRNFSVSDEMVNGLELIAAQNGIKKNDAQEKRSDALIRRYLKAAVARSIWGDEGYYLCWNDEDAAIAAAMKSL